VRDKNISLQSENQRDTALSTYEIHTTFQQNILQGREHLVRSRQETGASWIHLA